MDETKTTFNLQIGIRCYKYDDSGETETIDTTASKVCTLKIENYIPENANEGNIKTVMSYMLTHDANGYTPSSLSNNIYKFIDSNGDTYLFTNVLNSSGSGVFPIKNLIETASTIDETTTTLANIGWDD